MNALDVPVTREDAVAQSGWGLPVRFIQVHNPVFWVYTALLLNGIYVFFVRLSNAHVHGSTIFTAFVLQAVLAVPFVWFITRTDRYEREPAKLALIGFFWGGLIATFVMASPGNAALLSIYGKLFGLDFARTWGPSFTAPIVEETSKYPGLVVVTYFARQHVRCPYDGLLLGAFVGLGFQLFEDFDYIVNGVAANFASSPVQDALSVFVIRAMTGIFSHAFFTAVAGAGFGYFIGATGRSLSHRTVVALGFLLMAMVAHGASDSVGAIGYLAIPLNLGISICAGIIAWRFADSRQRTWMHQLLADEVVSGTVTATELEVLASQRKARSRYLKAIRTREGKSAAKQANYILDAEIELAAALAANVSPESEEVVQARDEVRCIRGVPTS